MAEIMNEQPLLSVVLATYNRADTLQETLRHLAAQELDPASYEVIVIDDGSPDQTRAVVAEWIDKAPFQLTYLHHSNRGPGYTQNRGLDVARAPIVLLMADDIWMSPQALKQHLSMHAAHPEQEVAVLGQVRQSAALDQSVFLRTWDPFRFSDLTGLHELPYYKFWACNISIKREFVMRYGPFQEHLGIAAHEDAELGYRLSRGGLRILYCPEALGFHHHVMTLEQACRRRHLMGTKFPEFCRLVPEPEIPVAYHVLNWRTLPAHLRAMFGSRREYLPAKDRNPLLLMSRQMARALLFNTVTLRSWWEPLMRRAESNPSIARWVNREIYRGVLFHYFLCGCRDGYRDFGQKRNSAREAKTTSG